jgi:hypothetical protein
VGIAIYYSYLIAPSFGVLTLATAALAIIAIGAFAMLFIAMPWARAGYMRWSSADER